HQVEESHGVAFLLLQTGVGRIQGAQGAVTGEDVALQIEASRLGRQGRKPMIPALSFQLGPESINPDTPRGIAPGLFAELARGAEREAVFELRIAGRAALLEYAIEGQLQAALIRVVTGAPVADPDRPWVARVRRGQDQFHAGITSVTGDRTLPYVLQRRKAAVMLDQVGVAFSVGLEQAADDAQSGALRVEVLLVARLGQGADDPLDVPFVGVKKETDERLLVIRVTAGVRLDDHAQALTARDGPRKQAREDRHAD